MPGVESERVQGGGRRAGGRIALAVVVALSGLVVPSGAAADGRIVAIVDGILPVVARDSRVMATIAPLPAVALPRAEPRVRAGAAYDSNPPQQAASFGSTAGDGSATPASPSGAVGPGHVLTVTAQEVRVQSRTGTTLSAIGLDAFWATLGSPDAYESRALYDPLRGRFIIASLANANSAASSVLMAVTATGDPAGTWHRYRFEADGTRDRYWADGLSLGFNDKWITAQAGMFEFGTAGRFSRVFLWDLDDTYEGGTNRIRYGDLYGFGASQSPAVTLDANVSSQDLVQNWKGNDGGSGSLRLLRVDGAVDAPMITDYGTIPVSQTWADTWPGPVLPQAGTAAKIHAGDARLLNVVRRGGSLWAAHTVFLPASGPTRAAAQWWQIDAGTAAVRQIGRVGGDGVHYAFPSIAVNANRDVVVGASRFSADSYPSAASAFRYAIDPPNLIRAATVFKPGESAYAPPDARWGAWSVTQADPAGSADLWTLQPYAGATDRWGVWWAQIRPAPGPSLHADSPLDFGPQRTMAPSALRTLTLLNDGQQDTTVGPVTLAGTDAGSFTIAGNGCTGQTLAPHQTCPLMIRFTPAADGPRTATVSIASTDPSGPDAVTLMGTGTPPEPAFKAVPSSVGFGNVVAGDPATPRSFTVTNADAALLNITGVSVMGPQAAEFAVAADGCTGASLAPGQTCAMTIAFTPADVGGRSAVIRFTHNAPGGAGDVPVSGNGIPPGGEPRISFVPSAVWFPATEPDRASAVPVRVYNIGTGTLIPGPASVTGPAAFAVTDDGCDGAALNPGSHCIVEVTFAPTEFGTRTATLRVPGNVPGGSATVGLNATASDATPPQSMFSTQDGDVIVGGGGAPLSEYNVVRGSTADRLSPIVRVTVRFRSSLHDAVVIARLSCDQSGRTCAWTATAPVVPGFYTVTTESVDTWGNREGPGAPLEIFVL